MQRVNFAGFWEVSFKVCGIDLDLRKVPCIPTTPVVLDVWEIDRAAEMRRINNQRHFVGGATSEAHSLIMAQSL